MTRETKIGLLVGLAFIIVIGILLADYSSNSMQPPQAQLGGTARNVRESVGVPGVRRTEQSSVAVDAVQPNRQVVIPADPSGSHGRTEVNVEPGNRTPRVINVGPEMGSLVVADVRSTETPAPGGSENAGGGEAMAGMKQYKAQSGDTVSAMARKFLGSASKTNREAIIKANPALASKPDKIVVGETYLIPVNASMNMERPATNETPANTPATDTRTAEKTKEKDAAKDAKTVTYTTKPGDSLWKIAIEQCGSGQSLAKIREMNKDVLKSGDAIKPNVTLKLPAKQ